MSTIQIQKTSEPATIENMARLILKSCFYITASIVVVTYGIVTCWHLIAQV